MEEKGHSHKKLYWICGSCCVVSTLISLCAIAIATSKVGKTEFDPSGFYGWVTAALSLLVAVLVVFLAFNYFYQEEKIKKIIDERTIDIINENNIEAKRYIDTIQVSNYWNSVLINLKNNQFFEAKVNIITMICFLQNTSDSMQNKMSLMISYEPLVKKIIFDVEEKKDVLRNIYDLNNKTAIERLTVCFNL